MRSPMLSADRRPSEAAGATTEDTWWSGEHKNVGILHIDSFVAWQEYKQPDGRTGITPLVLIREPLTINMIIPSLTLAAGKVWDKNNQDIPRGTYEKFFVCPQISVVCADHDEKTLALLKEVLKKSACTVQLPANDHDRVFDALDDGAAQIVLQKDSPLLGELPKDRMAISLECEANQAGLTKIASDIKSLKNRAASFLLNCRGDSKELSTALAGFVKELSNLVGRDVKLVTMGDIACSYQGISELHSIGVNVHVSSTLLATSLELGQAIVACLKSDRPDGLFSTIVVRFHGLTLVSRHVSTPPSDLTLALNLGKGRISPESTITE